MERRLDGCAAEIADAIGYQEFDMPQEGEMLLEETNGHLFDAERSYFEQKTYYDDHLGREPGKQAKTPQNGA